MGALQEGKILQDVMEILRNELSIFYGFSLYVPQGDVSLSYDVGNIIVYKVHEGVNKLKFPNLIYFLNCKVF